MAMALLLVFRLTVADPLMDLLLMGGRTEMFRDALVDGNWSAARFTNDKRAQDSPGYLDPVSLVGDRNPEAIRFLVEDLGYDPNDQNFGGGSALIMWLMPLRRGESLDIDKVLEAIDVWIAVGGDPCPEATYGTAQGMTALDAAIAWNAPAPVADEMAELTERC